MTDTALSARPIALRSPAPGVDAWTCELVRTAADVAALAIALSPAELARAARFGRDDLRDRYVVGRATLRTLLGARLGMRAQDVPIGRGRRGRPHVEGAASVDFNVTHTRGTALIAFASSGRIGVDIEHGERELNVAGVARKFMSPREQAMLLGLDDDARRRTLLRLWTCKEAMSKATGDALSAPFRRMDVDVTRSLELVDGPAPYEPAQWRLRAVDVAGGYVATVALWHEQASLAPAADH